MFTQQNNTALESETLLFKDTCFTTPTESAVFRELRRITDPQVAVLVQALFEGANGSLSSFSLPTSAFDTSAAIARFRAARSSGDERQIVAVDSPLLGSFAELTAVERSELVQARTVVAMPAALRQALARDDDQAIVRVYRPELLRPWMELQPTEHQRIAAAQDRLAAVARLRQAIAIADTVAIGELYRDDLTDHPALSPDERAQASLARVLVTQRMALRRAILGRDDEAVLAAFGPELRAAPQLISGDELQQVEHARQTAAVRAQVRALLAADDVERALTVEQGARLVLADRALSSAKRRYLTDQEPQNVIAHEFEGALEVCWEWPESQLIDVITVVYRRGGPPALPVAAQRDPATYLGRITRDKYKRVGAYRAAVRAPGPWHVRVFSSLQDRIRGRDHDQYAGDWVYSPSGSGAISARRFPSSDVVLPRNL
jgi:hypothetical protein